MALGNTPFRQQPRTTEVITLGLRQNLAQFMLLVAVNALVGGTLGQERTVLPLLAGQVFHLDEYTSALTYILAFGLAKAATNWQWGWTKQPATSASQAPHWLRNREVFTLTSFRDKSLSSVSQAGMVNNLNDGLAWGLFPVLFAAAGVALGNDFGTWLAAVVLLGAGTAMVYPTLLAAIGDVAHPEWRARSVGIYRLWRDGGFAVGALLSGIIVAARMRTSDHRGRG